MTKKVGRPAHEPTEALRDTVSLHAMVGTPQSVICEVLGINLKTLRKHYREELDLAVAQANAKVGGSLFNKALSGDTTAMIFWLKTRAGFKEKQEIDHTSSDKSMSPSIIKLVGPDDDENGDN